MIKMTAELAKQAYVTYLDDVQLADGLCSGSISSCVVIACADVGTNLPFVCSLPNTKLFVFQTPGHRVMDDELVNFLSKAEISDLIVYGHSDCEFAHFLAQSDGLSCTEKELISKYLKEESRTFVDRCGSFLSLDDPAGWKKAAEWRVLNELKSLLSHPRILRQTDSGKLRLHGWICVESDNTLEVFEPEAKKFIQTHKEGGIVGASCQDPRGCS